MSRFGIALALLLGAVIDCPACVDCDGRGYSGVARARSHAACSGCVGAS